MGRSSGTGWMKPPWGTIPASLCGAPGFSGGRKWDQVPGTHFKGWPRGCAQTQGTLTYPQGRAGSSLQGIRCGSPHPSPPHPQICSGAYQEGWERPPHHTLAEEFRTSKGGYCYQKAGFQSKCQPSRVYLTQVFRSVLSLITGQGVSHLGHKLWTRRGVRHLTCM